MTQTKEFTSPYLFPTNVHEREDGAVVAYGPHGVELVLTDEEQSAVEAMRRGEAPTYQDQMVAWQASLVTAETHPNS